MVLVFGHGCHSVFMAAKLHIGFSCRLPVRSHIDVDPQWIQRREELQEQREIYKLLTQAYTHDLFSVFSNVVAHWSW